MMALIASDRGHHGPSHNVTTLITPLPPARLDSGATIYDITHLPCRSAKYTTPPGGPDRVGSVRHVLGPGGYTASVAIPVATC